MEKQQHMLATNQQAMKNLECGVSSEIKIVPSGLSKGSDDRGLGAKRDPLLEETEGKGPKEITI